MNFYLRVDCCGVGKDWLFSLFLHDFEMCLSVFVCALLQQHRLQVKHIRAHIRNEVEYPNEFWLFSL